MGPLFIDLLGTELTSEETELLAHPAVGGVIFFSRNYVDIEQLQGLVGAVRAASPQPLILAVDQEGGRVQRFKDGFTRLPAMGELEKLSLSANNRVSFSQDLGWLMAAELLCCDIDISFAPVLDINGISDVIGDRGFSSEPNQVVELAGAFMQGMREAGMATTAKHFPGHGNVKEDSHVAMPVDKRRKADIFDQDLWVFKQLMQRRLVDAVMPAHVIYPNLDPEPAGFSEFWLQRVLRQQLGFSGVIFSDDLSMQGASTKGDYADRANAALEAGVDMLLACNNRKGLLQALSAVEGHSANPRVAGMRARKTWNWQQLKETARWQQTRNVLQG